MAFVHHKKVTLDSLKGHYKSAKASDKTLSKIVCDYRRVINGCNNTRLVTDEDLSAIQYLTQLYKVGATFLQRIPFIREASGIQFENVQLKFSTLAGEDYSINTNSVSEAVSQIIAYYKDSPVGGTLYDAGKVFKLKRHFKCDLDPDVLTGDVERIVRLFVSDKNA